ncbi:MULTISPECIES: helix-turn-helix domain-containing protein [Paracoccus]|jgi:CRP/FNR family transcriptional activator FtrB|uniref:Putative transcriptional regulator, Crp/Fnr family n=1 Tax=Paracoccus denitrificans (strain Pd 1222) TaxID=318586 RepID=A1B9V8_PARDP|nr:MULTISPECIES: helix-turn-helix domain-containing protein [Paracoccus]ABL72302.1 putative transcriptional regulator, Crp/Fnr family [Paracoccus denitrificans PD1222]MBB4629246.1 CRP/FNR family transcriptional activator FtrB [Paracoccus denitrificans]MCU7430266.1 helix-turn-helix domain-containing protein [Paracoccus denitrificans]MDK8875194.1 helix-turn-helix domain-containing protein [Paracoccus sp. SSJ]QAR28870.1 cyclic nucleotide-binding domain-containing protein [Paracoccus denitrificans
MREEDRNDIRNLPLFRNMTSPAFDALMHAAYDQVFPAQLELIRQGEVANFLHVVLEGAVELYANWQDRDTTMAVVQPVATFILAACMRDAPYLMSARTLRRSRIVLIPAVDVRAAFARDHGFALATVQELSEGYRNFVRHAKNLKLRNARERLGAYLWQRSLDTGGAQGFVLPQEKRLLASYLGMTPESLSRAFKALRDHGVHIDGMRVTITDPAALAALVQPNTLLDTALNIP